MQNKWKKHKMLINEIKLKNFLSYGRQNCVKLQPLNILIGTNGSGKSNFIEAIDLLHNMPNDFSQTIRDGGGISDWLWKGNQEPSIAEIETIFKFDDQKRINLCHKIEFTSGQQRLEIVDEKIEDALKRADYYDKKYFYYHFNKGHPYINKLEKGNRVKKRKLNIEDIDLEKSILAQRKDPDFYPEITWLGKNLADIMIYRNWNFGRYTPPRLPQKVDLPNKFLLPNCENLGLILNKIFADYLHKQQLLAFLKDANPSITDIHLQLEGGTVQLFIQESEFSIPATRISDGTLRLLCVLAALYNPTLPPLLCIEEPELGLHPDIIPTVAKILKSASEKTQIIVTTHSKALVDCFTDSPESIFVCEKGDEGSEIKRLRKDELLSWLKKYSLGTLWMQGEFGGTRW